MTCCINNRIVSCQDAVEGRVPVPPPNIEDFAKTVCYFGDHVEEDVLNAQKAGWLPIWVAPEILDIGGSNAGSPYWLSLYKSNVDLKSGKSYLVLTAENTACLVVPSVEWFVHLMSSAKSWTITEKLCLHAHGAPKVSKVRESILRALIS